MTNRFAVVRTRPECWQSGLELGELLAQTSRRKTFELLHDVVRRQRRWSFDEQMHVVGHDLHCVDMHANIGSFFVQKFFQPFGHSVYQHLAPILRTPNQVIANVVDRFVAGCPSLVCHDRRIAQDYTSVKCIMCSIVNTPPSAAGFHPTVETRGLSARKDCKERASLSRTSGRWRFFLPLPRPSAMQALKLDQCQPFSL